jgi:quercetin dioxygenase-like cupin family protein
VLRFKAIEFPRDVLSEKTEPLDRTWGKQMKAYLKFTLLSGVFLTTLGMALATDPPTGPIVINAAAAKWVDCPGMPPGCKTTALYGDAGEPGQFGRRFKYVAGYRIGPHTHAGEEHATVISGGPFHIAVGDRFDAKAPSGQALRAGDIVIVPVGIHHFAWAEGETVLQVNGMGPFKRDFINPADNQSGVPK